LVAAEKLNGKCKERGTLMEEIINNVTRNYVIAIYYNT
jgi:hypothetical protein